MKKSLLASLFAIPLFLGSCMNVESDEPKPIIDPVWPRFVSRDSIANGDHIGLTVNTDALETYVQIQQLRQKGVGFINVIGNITSELSQVDGRLKLYANLLLDEQIGTDTGVQINMKSGVISSIYLNSGRYLDQWPLKKNASSSIRIGDHADVLYQKLAKIKGDKSYTNKFERISLLAKDMSTDFDPAMAGSRQWYFRYQPEPRIFEDVEINFENGKVKYIIVSRYKDLS